MARESRLELADAQPLHNLNRGLDRSVAPTRIDPLGLHTAYNVVINDGRVYPRPSARPSTRYGSQLTANPCSMIGLFLNRSSGVFTPYRAESNFTTNQLEFFRWTGVMWSSVASGLSTSRDTPPQFTLFKDEAIVLPGDGAVYRWNPATLALATVDSAQADTDLRPPEAPRFVVATGARVFLANGRAPESVGGSERFSSRIWWSTTNDSTIWNNGTGKPERRSAGYQDTQHDTYPITGLAFHSGQQVIAFKDWSVYFAQWRGSPLWYDFVPMSTRIGCVASKTIKQWRDQLLFLGADCNVYAIAVNGQIQPVANRIQTYMRSIVDYSKLNRAVGLVDPTDNLYWLFVPTTAHESEFGRHIFCMDLETGAWTEGEFADSGIEVLDAFESRVFDEQPFLLFGGADGRIYEFDFQQSMTDRLTTFSANIWSRVYDFMEVFQGGGEHGEFHRMGLHGSSGTARPVYRTGRSIRHLEDSAGTELEVIDHDKNLIEGISPTPESVSGRTEAQRFGQWGVKWPAGTESPMRLDGVTPWVLGRS